ncbi:MAG TPA: DUF4369 domain-containing protein [Flavobacteriaceae bacterium]|nr:DUF4369 domain-containing protein [Flavobacteriaceae bacterium]
MKNTLIFTLALCMLSCTTEKNNVFINGNIKGLKKGTVYLLQAKDSVFKTLDSVVVNGKSNFTLSCSLDEPEVLFIKLNKNDNDTAMVDFFASEGTTTLTSTLKNFIYDADIQGSAQQNLLNEYRKMMYAYRNKNLELIEQHLQAQIDKDTLAIDSLQQSYNNYLKSQYRYSLNYAVTHSDSEVAPYIALSEMPDATAKVLDTLYSSLTEKVKNSKYGKLLKETLDSEKK